MTVEPPPDYREEVDIVRIDPLFLERQRNRYASRAVAFLVILNQIAALLLLANFARLSPQIENAPKVADAMVVFGAGVAAALASMFFAYLRRTIMLRAPERAPSMPFGWWLAILAALVSAVCFVVGLRMVGVAVAPKLVSSATISQTPVKGNGALRVLMVRRVSPDQRERKGRSRTQRRKGWTGAKGDPGDRGEMGPAGPAGPAGPLVQFTNSAAKSRRHHLGLEHRDLVNPRGTASRTEGRVVMVATSTNSAPACSTSGSKRRVSASSSSPAPSRTKWLMGVGG